MLHLRSREGAMLTSRLQRHRARSQQRRNIKTSAAGAFPETPPITAMNKDCFARLARHHQDRTDQRASSPPTAHLLALLKVMSTGEWKRFGKGTENYIRLKPG